MIKFLTRMTIFGAMLTSIHAFADSSYAVELNEAWEQNNQLTERVLRLPTGQTDAQSECEARAEDYKKRVESSGYALEHNCKIIGTYFGQGYVLTMTRTYVGY